MLATSTHDYFTMRNKHTRLADLANEYKHDLSQHNPDGVQAATADNFALADGEEAPLPRAELHRLVAASAVGNTLEFYDFAIFG